MAAIIPIPAFSDNYIWLLREGARAVVVDPGDAAPVRTCLEREGLRLAAILVTHHHGDHVGGIEALAGAGDVPVLGRFHRLFKILLSGHVSFDKRLNACMETSGLGDDGTGPILIGLKPLNGCPRRFPVGLGDGDLLAELFVVEACQQIALFHAVPLIHEHFGNSPGDFRTDG